jgi:hypothetical protein
MRKYLVLAGVAGLLSFAAGCGGGAAGTAAPPAAASCVGTGTHKAYVVVEHGDGKTLDRCVKFDGSTATGDAVMNTSGIKLSTQDFSFGKGVCAIDGEPAQYTQCFDPAKPYWALWSEKAGGSWEQAQVGYTQLQLADGDAIGWRYTQPTEASPSPPPAPKK